MVTLDGIVVEIRSLDISTHPAKTTVFQLTKPPFPL